MAKKRHNWKARQVVTANIDTTEQRKIKLDLKLGPGHDDCNALVLPSSKRKTTVKRPHQTVNKLLSKKERKRLEKIVERKKKKENRATLLESLAKVQLPSEELKKMTSIATVQTKGLKRFLKLSADGDVDGRNKKKRDSDEAEQEEQLVVEDVSMLEQTGPKKQNYKINAIGGNSKRRKLIANMNSVNTKQQISDPSIVGIQSSSDDDGEDDDDVVEIKQEPAEHINEEEEEEEAQVVNNREELKTGENESNEKQKGRDNENYNDVETNGAGCDTVQCKKSDAKSEAKLKPNGPRKKAIFVSVSRKPEIEAARHKLPILAEEQVIMEAINENAIVLIAGETGSGKTTQIPQFLYEAGYTANGKMIGVTEPRRVAAISMSRRVAEELSLTTDIVSYLIRFEGNATPKTQIKFMTDGVLLKEIQSDFLLTGYSVIIVDEAHERSVYTDILVGLLSRIVPLRNKKQPHNPLKLIIMSATLRIEDFTLNKHLFNKPPPVIKVESRQFPVMIHFNKRTNPDYMKEAFRKVCRIHTQLPDGGILVFLTGQQEVNWLVKKLRKTFPTKNKVARKKKAIMDGEDSEEERKMIDEEEEFDLEKAIEATKKKRKQSEITLPDINIDSYSCEPTDDTEGDMLANEDGDLSSDEDEHNAFDIDSVSYGASVQPLWVLPLYSLLPTYKQAKVFESAPEGTRLCVVATNVAETSLTIPAVKYVVDTGKVKTKLYDKLTGVTAFSVVWTSKASANQRAGRAGRVAPGHCYRLYSSAVFNDEFEEWSVPEMQKRNVDDLVLQMKALGIERVVNFPFPSPPDLAQLREAEKTLTLLGALHKPPLAKGDEWCGKLTQLGESMACFPVAPRYAKMLCLSHQHDLLQYTVALVAALSVQELLILQPADNHSHAVTRKRWAGQGNSLLLGDLMVLLRAIGAAEYANSRGELSKFCAENGLREKAVIEARKLRVQITNEINLGCPFLSLTVDPKMKPPTDNQAKLLRQIVCAGMVDRVARRCEIELVPSEGQKKLATRKAVYSAANLEPTVQIHSSSALRTLKPEWVVYQELYSTNDKFYIRGITGIEPEWLVTFGRNACCISEPLSDPPPRYDHKTGRPRCHVTATFGRSGWELPLAEIEFPSGLDRYKWFAVFLLDGSVCPKLAKYTQSLLSAPHTMTKSWAKLQPRTEFLLKTLVSKEADSKDKLLAVWKTEPSYLLSAYQKWLPESAHNELAIIWPPTDD